MEAAKLEFDLGNGDEDPTERHKRKQVEQQDTRLYLIRRTVLQMLRDRGYLIGDMDLSMSREQFRERFGNDIKRSTFDSLTSKESDPNDQIYVFFPEEIKVGVTVIKKCAEAMKEHSLARAIVVVQKDITLFAKQSVSEMSGKYRVEVFQDTELLVNIKNCVVVPKHIVLTADEHAAILERFCVKPAQIPRLRVDDPVARYYGLSKGQMVKIIRKEGETLRYVV